MNDDDQMETRLRRALNTEAAMVQPAGDGLQKIRGGIDARRHRSWWRSPAMALVAAAVLGLAVGGLVFGLGGKDNGGTVAPQQQPDTNTDGPPVDLAEPDRNRNRGRRIGLRLLRPRRRPGPAALPGDSGGGRHRFTARGGPARHARGPPDRS